MTDTDDDTPDLVLFEGRNLNWSVDMVLRPKDMASKPKTDPVEEIKQVDAIQCGSEARKQFGFADGYRNLNHGQCFDELCSQSDNIDTSIGSFGTYPLAVRKAFRYYQELSEERPDAFIRYDYPKLLDQSRQAVADYLHAPVEGCVFVSNATTGINTVLRGLVYQPGDVIVYFATIYGACGKTVSYITETTPAESRKIEYTYPVSDKELCNSFERAIEEIRAEGKNPRIAIYDTIASLPGVRMPFEELTKLCRKHKVLSCVDGAHSVGGIPMNIRELDPDFYVSNCHKWLYVPRGCAIFYVAERNHHLIRSTLPTSHGFEPRPVQGEAALPNPLPPSAKTPFITNFEFVGTMDNSPFLCVPGAIEWRKKIRWNDLSGDEAIYAYNAHIAREAGELLASKFGTEVMENEEQTLTKCVFSNVRLPLSFQNDAHGNVDEAIKIAQWIAKTLVEEYDTFIAIIFYGDAFWVRLSGQVYLTLEDFEWAAETLLALCEGVRSGLWR